MKKVIATIGALTLTAVIAVSAFGITPAFQKADVSNKPAVQSGQYNGRNGGCAVGVYMRDENGNFLSREDYEKALDKEVEAGTITKEDKQAYLEYYDFCVENAGNRGGRGCGGNGGGCGRRV